MFRVGDGMGVRLAVVGSTSFEELYGLDIAEWIIKRALVHFDPEVVISGGARGVDRLAEKLAIDHGFRTTIHDPAHPRWEPHGYKDRNLRIAQDCTHLIAIRCRASTTYGSGWTYQQTKRLGKTVFMREI